LSQTTAAEKRIKAIDNDIAGRARFGGNEYRVVNFSPTTHADFERAIAGPTNVQVETVLGIIEPERRRRTIAWDCAFKR
jgi:hypothetical protein